MTVSVVLRLVPGALAEGRLAGHAEVVDTGRTTVFRDADELLRLLRLPPVPQGTTTTEVTNS